MNQRIMPLARFHHHVAAAPAISARRSSARHEFLAPEGHAAVSAVAGLHSNFGFINKHKYRQSRKSRNLVFPAHRASASGRAAAAQTRSRRKRRLFSLPNHFACLPPADRRPRRHAVNVSMPARRKRTRRCDADYFSTARFGLRIARNLLLNPIWNLIWAARKRNFSLPHRIRRQSGSAF
jgi:hypothetical protein